MNRYKPIYLYGFITFFLLLTHYSAYGYLNQDEMKKREQLYDKKGILRKTEMQTDTSEDFITIPSGYPEVKDFDVAKTPPTIDFAIVQGLEPWYLSNDGKGTWLSWSDVSFGPGGCFYFSICNQLTYNGNAYMHKYDPATKTQSIVIDLNRDAGFTPGRLTDAKFHGDPEISPDGDMWLLTYWGNKPTNDEINTVYEGGLLIRYNVLTGEFENLGTPLEHNCWPYFAHDWNRGIFFAVSAINNYVLAYDTNAREMIFLGNPPLNIRWNSRAALLDSETGIFYATSQPENSGGPHFFVSWKRENNTFTVMNATVPTNPLTGENNGIRDYTKRKDAHGAFWCFDLKGTFFKFYPDEDRTELVGVNWGNTGKTATSLCLSPGGRYVYYVPDGNFTAHEYGTPVVQYDIQTGHKKVIAFLNDFYLKEYGYSPCGTWGASLDDKGESIFFYTNGVFSTKELGSDRGRPAIFHVHIPETERMNDIVMMGVDTEAPPEFSVAQNSPNYFNPTTTIRFIIVEGGNVTIEVFNVAGQKVDTVVNEFMDAGSHSVVWDGSDFSAGVYFYTVKFGDYSKTMKMTLIK